MSTRQEEKGGTNLLCLLSHPKLGTPGGLREPLLQSPVGLLPCHNFQEPLRKSILLPPALSYSTCHGFVGFFFSSHAESCKPRPRGARVAPRQLWYLSFKDIFSILQCSNTICCFARRRFHRRGAFLGVNCSLKYILTVLEAGKTPQKVPQPWSVMATLTVGETQG